MPRYAVTRSPGSGYDHSVGIRQQRLFAEHAVFMDALADDGFVVMGGSIGDQALLVIDAGSPEQIHARLADDPWVPTDIIVVSAIDEWNPRLLAPALRPDRITMWPVGRVVGGRTEPIDDDWGDVEATIEIDARFEPDVLAGLDGFSHVDVVFVFDRVDEARITLGARHPRNNPEWPLVGIFAQRAKARPNRIGVSTCELVGVDGRTLRVRGLDAIDATPVLDIKPHVREFDPRTPLEQPEWMTELMSGYW